MLMATHYQKDDWRKGDSMKVPDCDCIHIRHGADIEVFVIVDHFINGALVDTDEMNNNFINFCPQCGKAYKEEI
jgi:hypothetical protein